MQPTCNGALNYWRRHKERLDFRNETHEKNGH
jgi:hypothetical protein